MDPTITAASPTGEVGGDESDGIIEPIDEGIDQPTEGLAEVEETTAADSGDAEKAVGDLPDSTDSADS